MNKMNFKLNSLTVLGVTSFVAATFGLTMSAVQSQSVSTITVDGSSTVFPITEAAAEDFQKAQGGRVRVTVGVSGTGGGFKSSVAVKQIFLMLPVRFCKKKSAIVKLMVFVM